MLISVKVNEVYIKWLKLKWIVLSCCQLEIFQKDLHSCSLLFNLNNRMCQQTLLEEIYIVYLETYQFIELLLKFKPVRLSKWQKPYLSYSLVCKYSAWKIGFKLHMFCKCNSFKCSPTKNVVQQKHSCLISGHSNLLNYSSLLSFRNWPNIILLSYTKLNFYQCFDISSAKVADTCDDKREQQLHT